MTKQEIKKKVLQYNDWEIWLERPFGAFLLSLFTGGNSRRYMQKLGFDIEHEAMLFDHGAWYSSKNVYEKAVVDIKKEISNGLSVRKISESCERFREEKRERIKILLSDGKIDHVAKFKEVVEILTLATSYIWLAHDFEYYYTPIFRNEVKKYFKGDIDKIIGDISYPKKKNSHNFLEEELSAGADTDLLVMKYGWMKARDGFADPFTKEELKGIRRKLQAESEVAVKKVNIPGDMKSLLKEMQELVYYRTLRTDVFYELMFLARPITRAVGKKYGLSFKALRNYSVYDLIAGKPIKYPPRVAYAYYKDKAALFTKPIISNIEIKNVEVKGTIAYKGIARGIVKIIKNVESLGKMLDGDILVAPMTSPNFLVAMKKAVAFVTDEGGITCHAAIIAREMKKPCIIGTKIATKVLHDGDLVEVNADKGVVRIIKNAREKKI